MYEDFSYITDERFLTKYWDKAKILCPYCEGTGELSFDSEVEMLGCHLCQGTGWISHQQYEESLLESHISVQNV